MLWQSAWIWKKPNSRDKQMDQPTADKQKITAFTCFWSTPYLNMVNMFFFLVFNCSYEKWNPFPWSTSAKKNNFINVRTYSPCHLCLTTLLQMFSCTFISPARPIGLPCYPYLAPMAPKKWIKLTWCNFPSFPPQAGKHELESFKLHRMDHKKSHDLKSNVWH